MGEVTAALFQAPLIREHSCSLPQDRGRPEAAREDSGREEAGETVAPEEKGHEVETENAPGSDL